LGEGKITLYNSEGTVISDFGKEILYSQENGESLMHPEGFEDQRKNY
jgi:hypothetical protein